MKISSKQIFKPICLCFAALLSLTFLALAFSKLDSKNVSINNSDITEFNDGWYYLNGTQKEYVKTLPKSIDVNGKSIISVTNTIPRDLTKDTVMCVKTTYQAIQVYINDELIYDFGTENNFGLKYGSVLNMINISESQKGQNIILKISSSSFKTGNILNGIVLGDKDSIILFILRNNLGTIIFSTFILVLGIMLIAFAIYLTFKPVRINRNSYLFLGTFLILAVIWILSDTDLFQLVNIGISAKYLISFFSFLLFPIPFLLYIKEMCNRGRKTFDVLCLIFAGWFFVNLICYVFNIIELTKILYVSHLLIVLSILSILYYSALEKFKYHSNSMNLILIGTSVLCVTSLMNLIVFYFSFDINNSYFFRIGIIVFVLLLCFDILKKSLGLLNSNTKTLIYKQLAYTDVATGLKNRAAYDISIKELNYNWCKSSVCLILFDIDNLKINNDTLGHLVGDELISGVAKCIKKAFMNYDSCYRIGGDEFAVLLNEDKQEIIDSFLKEFENCIKQYNDIHQHKISVSHGYAIATKFNPKFKNVCEFFNSADMNMYSNKSEKSKCSSSVSG